MTALGDALNAARLDPDAFVGRVYDRLFAMNPAVRDLFGVNLSMQYRSFWVVLEHVWSGIEQGHDPQPIVELLAQLGRDHRKYGVLPEHYDTMTAALRVELERLLPGPNPDVARIALLTCGVMRGGAHSATTPAIRTAVVAEVVRPFRNLSIVRLRAAADAPFDYTAGQYIETNIPQHPRTWRNYSLATPPNAEGMLEFHISGVDGGWVSKTIATATAPGDVWRFGHNHGALTVDRNDPTPVVIVAGGTGAAPALAIIAELSRYAQNPPVRVVLAARSPGMHYAAREFAAIAATNPWLELSLTIDSADDPWWIDPMPPELRALLRVREGGVADAIAVEDFTGHRALVSGPSGMIAAARTALHAAGVAQDSILSDPL